MSAYTPGHVENFTTEESGKFLVKKTNEMETETYKLLAKDQKFSGLIPKIVEDRQREDDPKSYEIKMEHLTGQMSQDVAWIDLKLGYWLHNEGHTDYTEKFTSRDLERVLELDPTALNGEERKAGKWSKSRQMGWRMKNTSSGTEFFCINGFRHSKIEKKYQEYHRFQYDSQLASALLQDFFNSFEEVKIFVVEQMKKIKNALSEGTLFKRRTPFHSSIFICFDLNAPNEKHDVRLIDFGRSYLNNEVKPEVQTEQQKSILSAIDNIIESITNRNKSKKKIAPINKVDFDKVDLEFEEMEKQMADNDVNIFLEQLFAKSSPEVQMAMKKSYLESKGTVLSTDWSDVGSKDVKPYESDN